MADKRKVIIIGAGIAGLSAANHLQTGHIDTCVLEATKRVGGRMCTNRTGHDIIELGAASIHGTVGNPIYDFVCKNNLLQGLDAKSCSQSLSDCSVEHVVFSACGEVVDKKLVEEVSEVYDHIMKAATNKPKTEKLARNAEKPQSVGTYLQEEFQKYLDVCEDRSHKKLLKERVFYWLQRVECVYCGCQTLCDLNLEDLGEYKELEGPVRCPVPMGYDSVAQILASNLPKNCICFNHIVNEIKWNDTHGAHPVQVICENGKCFDADHVIVTVPLGVLKLSHRTLFNPSLPREKVQAIENLGFGICDKIFLEFEKPFWSGSQYRINFVWVLEDTADGIPSCPYPSWVYTLFCFYTVSTGSNTLMGWVQGDAAIEVERTTPDEVGKYCLDVLGQFTGIKSFPKLVSVCRTQWSANPYSRGSYSYVAREARGSDIDVLASPLPCKEAVVNDGSPPLQVLFAGEATHRHFYSTVHGAYISGIREANRISSLLPKSKSHL